MLRRNSLISKTTLVRTLKHRSVLSPEQKEPKKSLAAGVILTSLIDAFSILVIYLLVNFSNSGEMLYISKDMELPSMKEPTILERVTLVKIEKGEFFVEEKKIDAKDITAALIEVKKSIESRQFDENKEKNLAITIQADRRIHFELLNKVVLASQHAGFNEVKFAVLAN